MLVLVAVALLAAALPVREAAAGPECADAIIDEWAAGALQPTYSLDCYEAAVDALPEDLRAYTTAADDISRVATTASRSGEPARSLASTPTSSQSARDLPLVVGLLGAFVVVLAASGLSASLLRRRRSR